MAELRYEIDPLPSAEQLAFVEAALRTSFRITSFAPGAGETQGARETPEPVWEPEPQPAASGFGDLEEARSALQAARTSGNRRDVLAASQSLVDVLRPLAASDAGTWGRELVTALEDLGEAKFRAGDWWGSRGPKKEAKQLAKDLGL